MLDPRTLGTQRLAALGALGAAGGLALLMLVLSLLIHPFPRGGMDGTNYALTLMSFAGVLGSLIAVHLVFAHQLWYAPRSEESLEQARLRAKRKARS